MKEEEKKSKREREEEKESRKYRQSVIITDSIPQDWKAIFFLIALRRNVKCNKDF